MASHRPYPWDPGARLQGDESSAWEQGPIPPADSTDLGEAVIAARQGLAAGWNRLFDEFHTDVYRYALARIGRRPEAEDITQEVFVAAVRGIGALRDTRRAAVHAWFLSICRNKIVDHVRHQKSAGIEAEFLSPGDADPGAELQRRIDAAEIRAAMANLTDEQRDVLIRRFVLDQSLESVALATGRTVGAIKSLQHRALTNLARRLPPEMRHD